MKVYLILVQASYDDGFSISKWIAARKCFKIHSILNDEVKAIAKAKNLNENKKSSYDEYWVEEWNVET